MIWSSGSFHRLHADGDGFLADVEVAEAADQAHAVELAGPLLEAANQQHRAVGLEQGGAGPGWCPACRAWLVAVLPPAPLLAPLPGWGLWLIPLAADVAAAGNRDKDGAIVSPAWAARLAFVSSQAPSAQGPFGRAHAAPNPLFRPDIRDLGAVHRRDARPADPLRTGGWRNLRHGPWDGGPRPHFVHARMTLRAWLEGRAGARFRFEGRDRGRQRRLRT